MIESPDRLDIVRIDPLQSPFTLEKPGGVLANTKAKLPPVIATKALKDATVFAFRNTEFDRGFSPKCSPEPGILFRFTRKRRTVESAFCAMCGAVFFYRSGEKKSVMQYVDRKPFLGVARIAFPKDEALSGGTD